MKTICFKTKHTSGKPGIVTVGIGEEGNVVIEQKLLIPKISKWQLIKGEGKILRETDNYIYVVRFIHMHRSTFAATVGAANQLISVMPELPEKFPDTFIK